MGKVVKVINKTGSPADTQVIVDGKMLPLSHMLNVDVAVRPDGPVVARVSLLVDEVDTLAKLSKED